ncbi:TM2 domain-containing protein [Natranaerobius thermophilus]|uniref:TM2 domain containing protein n=1 Tax=Natranaerobius thermophilus (strain ATCC BAA-1301 / DSM 18059 / JW/NM-WN-LF) TaxID=457570 RepID=B2A5B8_NATTJ|nr:TM2 domain-containing protein [Natranaerobius thermophilus]ACB83952.1 TM2 domain containing protein [Natranaerobius thermophilus JW/NM-WN-LF]
MYQSIQVKNPGVAAVLSFLWAGLGQIYNGQIGKGIAIMIVQVINAFLIFVMIGFITYPIVWIWMIYDAYKTAERINKEQQEYYSTQFQGQSPGQGVQQSTLDTDSNEQQE